MASREQVASRQEAQMASVPIEEGVAKPPLRWWQRGVGAGQTGGGAGSKLFSVDPTKGADSLINLAAAEDDAVQVRRRIFRILTSISTH